MEKAKQGSKPLILPKIGDHLKQRSSSAPTNPEAKKKATSTTSLTGPNPTKPQPPRRNVSSAGSDSNEQSLKPRSVKTLRPISDSSIGKKVRKDEEPSSSSSATKASRRTPVVDSDVSLSEKKMKKKDSNTERLSSVSSVSSLTQEFAGIDSLNDFDDDLKEAVDLAEPLLEKNGVVVEREYLPKKPSRGSRVPITLDLIMRTHFPSANLKRDELISKVLSLSHIRLDRQGITEIDNMDCLGPVTNLYIQYNKISKIENLECLPMLRYLVISHNQIKSIPDLSFLKNLISLDVSFNMIDTCDFSCLPGRLAFLDLSGNPISSRDAYRTTVLEELPALKFLDGVSRETSIEGEESEDDDEDDHEAEEQDGPHHVALISPSREADKIISFDLHLESPHSSEIGVNIQQDDEHVMLSSAFISANFPLHDLIASRQQMISRREKRKNEMKNISSERESLLAELAKDRQQKKEEK